MKRLQPQMLPAEGPTQNPGPGRSDCLNGPHSTSNAEDRVAQEARRKIQARLKMAMLFQRYRAQLVSNEYNVTVTSCPVSTKERICLTVHENKVHSKNRFFVNGSRNTCVMVTKVVQFIVKNSGVTAVYLTFCASDLVKNIFTVRDSHGNIIKTIKQHLLEPGVTYEIWVHFYSDYAGFFEQLLIFKFETCQQSSDKFEILRLLEIIHQTSFPEELLPTDTDSSCSLQSMKWNPDIGSNSFISWVRPFVRLKRYGMPSNIKDICKSHPDLQRPLSWESYSQRFHLLLHLEEFQLKKEIEKCNQDDLPMFRHKSYKNIFILQISGVSKSLISKLPKNMVRVTPLDRSRFDDIIYEGWVKHVDGEQVYLSLDEIQMFKRRFEEGMRFNVKFILNRIPLRVQHRAVELVHMHHLQEVLFPTGQQSSHHSHLHRLLELKDNPEQHKAVQHIVAGTAKPAPYLVFGPPGTGKTLTLVEAIKQIVKTQSKYNILACAPSNSATDHLCEKILGGEIGEHSVYRLYSLTYPVSKIPQKIKFFCNLDHETDTFIIPCKQELMTYKIMVTTLHTAQRLVSGGIPPGHYMYIFVDEAGQATETECIIPISGLLKPRECQVVLAGDPKQLGPIIASRMAEEHGMGLSLLERLMTDIDLYKSHEQYGFNNRFVTKLVRNYRSHPAILKIPNELFYEGELQACVHKEKCNSYCKWEWLPKKGFPLIFHGVAGTYERDANSPSVYNMAEVDVLMEYLKALVDHLHKKGVSNIEPREIGIIAPYTKQVEKIQNALQMDKDLRKENLENVLVGSVEKFQGKEFNVILVSTVRTAPKLTAYGQRFTLGFINNEKRFNVALTRARALLIVIGDPRALNTDQIWNKFIYYCHKEGGYRGITVTDAEEEEVALTNVH